MGVLEASARLYLQKRNEENAERELDEAFLLAERAGDKATLQKILQTLRALAEARINQSSEFLQQHPKSDKLSKSK